MPLFEQPCCNGVILHETLERIRPGKLVDRADVLEKILKFCNTHTEICMAVFNLESFRSHAEGSHLQNCMVEQLRNQVSEIHVDKSRNPSIFQCWKMSFKTEVCSCSNFPTYAMLWIKEVEMVDSVDDLKTSRSVGGHRFPNFEMLDAKIASALKKIIIKPYFHVESQSGEAQSTRLKWKTDSSVEDRLRI